MKNYQFLSGAASVILPGTNETGRERIWVTGGESSSFVYEITSEIFTRNESGVGNWETGPELPIALSDHCLVQIDEHRTLLSGGDASSDS